MIVFFLSCLPACAPFSWQTEEQNLSFFSQEDNAEDLEKPIDFDSIFERTACTDFELYVWSYIYSIASNKNQKPVSHYAMKERIVSKIKRLAKTVDTEEVNQFAARFVSLYRLITEFMKQDQKEDITTALVQFEHGVVNQSYKEFTQKLEEAFSALSRSAKQFNTQCPDSNSPFSDLRGRKDYQSVKWFFDMKRKVHPLIYGAKKVMSTAYQSCSVLDMPLMSSQHHTSGIYIRSRHPSRSGYRRAVSDLNQVNRSHYYLSQLSLSSHPQCFKVHSSPLLYDYGGKPAVSMNSINLFQNSGSGSEILGLDCSGFVVTAMATAGLRLKEKMHIRPVHVKGINSWMIKNSDKNQLSCLKKQDISVENPLQPGDIIASNTHTAIVEMVDEYKDSFYLRRVASEKECHSSRIKPEWFNFSIIQSSAHNNGVGINRMHIAESLSYMSSAFVKGLRRTASRACYKTYDRETHKNISEISILRHDINNPACRDREIYLDREECLEACEPVSI